MRNWRVVWGVILFGVLAACSGGSGGGCGSSCGMQPLPAGYPRDQAIENAATVRVTRSGLDFVSTNGPNLASKLIGTTGGILNFDLPESTSGDNVICVGGPVGGNCRAEINVGAANIHVDAVTPHALRLRGTIPVKLSTTPVKAKFVGVSVNVKVGYGDNGKCVNNAPQTTPHALPLDITIPLVAETVKPRNGYLTLDVDKAVFDLSGLSGDDVEICTDCGFATFICDGIVSLAKGLIVDQLRSGVESTLKGALAGFTCTKPSLTATPACPDGSKPDVKKEKCVYDLDPLKCVPTLFGTEGHLDLGSLLRSISPGTQGSMDFALAASGDMQPYPKLGPDNVGYAGHTPNGMTLGMMGGALPSPVSNCVKPVQLAVPTGIPTPDELTQDKITPWGEATGPHVGIGISGRFLDFTFGNLYNSGFLCLGISTEQIPLIQSGLLSLFVPSLKAFTFNRDKAPVAITTRPGAPPKVSMGGGTDPKKDPLLKVSLPKFAIDFYLWSYDRYIRMFTYTADLTIPLTLQTAKTASNPNGGIVPALGDIGVANDALSNYDQILDDPKKIADGLKGVVGGLAGQFVGAGVGPIDVSSLLGSFGIGLTIPDGGIRKLQKDQDEFLTIFANFKTTTTALPELDTTASLVARKLDAASLEAGTQSLELDVRSPTAEARGVAAEFAYQVDQSPWSAWSRDKHLVLSDAYLRMQGKHVLRVTSRLPFVVESQDATPVEIPFTIDTIAPHVDVKVDKAIEIEAYDFVSLDKDLQIRTRIDDAAFGPWTKYDAKAIAIPAGARSIAVEVKDEEGNIGQTTQPLIRGRGDPTLAPAGCGCDTTGQARPLTSLWFIPAAATLFLVITRRRKGAARGNVRQAVLAVSSLVAVSAGSQGCDCGSDDEKTQCGADCNQKCEPALPVGIVGAYLSLAKGKDGTIWAAGFNDAAMTTDVDQLYGDLVVGKYDQEKQRVMWRTVDGLPAPRTDGTCPVNDSKGWRKGELDEGDTVGLWTSIQVGDDGRPRVTYYDQTNKTLKFAIADGDSWKVHVVLEKSGADVGRYGKLLLVGGKPVVTFLTMEPGKDGRTRSKVVVARANTDAPGSSSDWSFEDASVDETGPCTAKSCGGDACVKSTGACTKRIQGCTPADCGSGKACVAVANKATCVDLIGTDTLETYPNAFGAYVSAANGPQGLGIVAYDRLRGNLVSIAKQNNAWVTTILDGETGKRPDAKDTGDVGMAASLAITADGTWHVSYVNGFDESLHYIAVVGGKPQPSEKVDDGAGLDNAPFADGVHVVGDDSSIRVDNNVVSITYQDATNGTLRVATGTLKGATHTWSRKAVNQGKKFAGFFPSFVPGEGRVANFWRETVKDSREMTGDVTLIAP